MVLRIKGDDLIFSTGRMLYANNGVVGINPNLEISEGFDGWLEVEVLTAQERSELADYAISQWTKWRDK